MTSAANDTQVGGDHYKKLNAAYQHWDFAVDLKLNHLEASATKYLARHMNKNGRQDLEKAAHYVQKLIECADVSRVDHRQPYEAMPVGQRRCLREFLHSITGRCEADLVYRLATWLTIAELREILGSVRSLTEIAYPREEGAVDSRYVNQG